MDKNWKEKILILAKTYPSPSSKYVETSCVAGINEAGVMRRLFPVPFRMISDAQQFKKWQWVDVRIAKATHDHRNESHKIYVDTIDCQNVIDSKKDWIQRRPWLNKIPTFNSIDALNSERISSGLSLAILKPKKITSLEVVNSKNNDWTDEEKEKLLQDQMQSSLFSELVIKKEINELKKLPHDFYYTFVCDSIDGEKSYRQKIVDWEAGALYLRCKRQYGDKWLEQFRKKLEENLMKKDLMFLMGNQHRFQDQWLIISLIYPPKISNINTEQAVLF